MRQGGHIHGFSSGLARRVPSVAQKLPELRSNTALHAEFSCRGSCEADAPTRAAAGRPTCSVFSHMGMALGLVGEIIVLGVVGVILCRCDQEKLGLGYPCGPIAAPFASCHQRCRQESG